MRVLDLERVVDDHDVPARTGGLPTYRRGETLSAPAVDEPPLLILVGQEREDVSVALLVPGRGDQVPGERPIPLRVVARVGGE